MIPKVAHLVWNHRRILESDHPFVTRGIKSLIDLNPDWRVNLYVPEEVDEYLRDCLTEEGYDLVRNRHFVSRIDLWRLFKVYYEGGLYMDIDKMVNVPLSSIVTEGTRWVVPTTLDYDFSCDVFASAPGNPALKQCFEMYLSRVKAGWTDQYLLGPQTYMHAVSYTLLGEVVNTDPGPEKFKELRDKIAEMQFAVTYREVPPNDMLLYRGDRGHELEAVKRDFYASEGIKHWTGDW